MLLQSHAGELHLLPALDSAWAAGSIKGLCARGGFEVGIAWENGRLAHASIRSKLGRECRLRTTSRVQVTLEGKAVEVSMPESGVVRSRTQAGSTHHVDAR
jgi:alpha-L-fucosidase 2